MSVKVPKLILERPASGPPFSVLLQSGASEPKGIQTAVVSGAKRLDNPAFSSAGFPGNGPSADQR